MAKLYPPFLLTLLCPRQKRTFNIFKVVDKYNIIPLLSATNFNEQIAYT